MTDRRDDGEQASGTPAPTAITAVNSRRTLLRGATAAVPTILTLTSGAALARSSNCINLAQGAPVDPDGRHLCLDFHSVTRIGDKRYDLGAPPSGSVTRIPADRTYYRSGSTHKVSVQEMCNSGGQYYYKTSGGALQSDASGWGSSGRGGVKDDADTKKVTFTVPKGGMVSAAALASFASHISFKDI